MKGNFAVPASVVEREQHVSVEEGESIQAHCTPQGIPRPQVVWRREDTRAIRVGRWMRECYSEAQES